MAASSEEFTWHVRVRATGKRTATAYVRKSTFEIGVPLQFDEEYENATALEMLLAALGADVVNGFREVARRRRVEVHEVEVLVSGRVNNPLTHLGVVGEEGHPGLEQAMVRVYAGSDADETLVRQAWDDALARSPLIHTLRPTVKLNLSLTVTV
ncbi:MAG: OsmC family protein [Chloroflexi bacterium]|nr:OsmC family protein [Chloroflexota bacterium]